MVGVDDVVDVLPRTHTIRDNLLGLIERFLVERNPFTRFFQRGFVLALSTFANVQLARIHTAAAIVLIAAVADEGRTLIQQIEQYLQVHYCEPEFTVQKAASQFNLSMSNLSHYFKSHTGVTVSDYVESLRLNLAQTLLAETDKSVSEISALVGYLQPASFMRAFKKVLGVSPTNWRNAQHGA